MQAHVDSGRNATRGDYVPFVDHSLLNHDCTVTLQLLVCARMCGRTPALKETRRSQKEGASAYRYFEWCSPGGLQPVDETTVMLEVPGAESTGDKKQVVRVESPPYRLCLDTQTPIVDH